MNLCNDLSYLVQVTRTQLKTRQMFNRGTVRKREDLQITMLRKLRE